MKKIVYIITRIENTGPNRVLQNMLLGIEKSKYKVYVVSLFNNKNCFNVYPDVEYISLNLKNILVFFLKRKSIVRRIQSEINPDIIHSHGILPDCLNGCFKSAYKISTLHCNIYEDYAYNYGFIKSFFMIKIHLFLLRHLNRVVCCSNSVYNEMKKSNINKICFVENGIACNYRENVINIRKELSIKENDLIYLYVGALTHRKNVQMLVNLFQKGIFENEHLIILGDGNLKKTLLDMVNTCKNIHILGFKNNIEDYLFCSDVYVSASLTEGLSISVIEALESGLLLLLSDIDSHREVFNKDDTYIGELFCEHDFDMKIGEIRKRVNHIDKNILKEYKQKYFSEKSMMKKYEVIYEKEK